MPPIYLSDVMVEKEVDMENSAEKGGEGGGEQENPPYKEEATAQGQELAPAEVLFSATMADIDRQGILHEMSLTITTDHLSSEEYPFKDKEGDLSKGGHASDGYPSKSELYSSNDKKGDLFEETSHVDSTLQGLNQEASNQKASKQEDSDHHHHRNHKSPSSMDWHDMCLLGTFQAGIADRLKVLYICAQVASAVHRITAKEVLVVTLQLPLKALVTPSPANANNNNNNNNNNSPPSTTPPPPTPITVEVQIPLHLREGDDLGQIIRTQLISRFGEALEYGAAVEVARRLSSEHYPTAVAGIIHPFIAYHLITLPLIIHPLVSHPRMTHLLSHFLKCIISIYHFSTNRLNARSPYPSSPLNPPLKPPSSSTSPIPSSPSSLPSPLLPPYHPLSTGSVIAVGRRRTAGKHWLEWLQYQQLRLQNEETTTRSSDRDNNSRDNNVSDKDRDHSKDRDKDKGKGKDKDKDNQTSSSDQEGQKGVLAGLYRSFFPLVSLLPPPIPPVEQLLPGVGLGRTMQAEQRLPPGPEQGLSLAPGQGLGSAVGPGLAPTPTPTSSPPTVIINHHHGITLGVTSSKRLHHFLETMTALERGFGEGSKGDDNTAAGAGGSSDGATASSSTSQGQGHGLGAASGPGPGSGLSQEFLRGLPNDLITHVIVVDDGSTDDDRLVGLTIVDQRIPTYLINTPLTTTTPINILLCYHHQQGNHGANISAIFLHLQRSRCQPQPVHR